MSQRNFQRYFLRNVLSDKFTFSFSSSTVRFLRRRCPHQWRREKSEGWRFFFFFEGAKFMGWPVRALCRISSLKLISSAGFLSQIGPGHVGVVGLTVSALCFIQMHETTTTSIFFLSSVSPTTQSKKNLFLQRAYVESGAVSNDGFA